MRLATIKLHGAEVAGIVVKNGILPVSALNAAKGTGWKEDMMSLIQAGHIPGLTNWYNNGGKEELETMPGLVPAEEVVYAPLYRNPKRIFGIGLNYKDHAGDIGSATPTGFPGSFFKMADTLVDPGDVFGPGGEGYLRMSFANSYENIVEGCRRLGEAVAALRAKQ